jgi:NarL family two-component system response regulator LiaR
MTSTVAEQIRVCVADDHAVVRQGLNAFLSSQPDIIVVGEAATGEELLRIAAREQPHVALVDLLMPGIGGIETTRLLRQAHPETQVIVLTSSTAQAHVIRALRAGALSYVLKDSTAEQIATAIRLAAQGQRTIGPAIRTSARRLSKPANSRGGGLASLTDRELQVLRCIAAGLNNAIIAEQLTITEGTVKPT